MWDSHLVSRARFIFCFTERSFGVFFVFAFLFRFSFYSFIMESDKLLLVNFRGQVLPMTAEQYQDFLDSLREGEWD